MPRCSSSRPVSTHTAAPAVGPQDRAQAVEAGGAGQVQVEQHAVEPLQLAAADDLVDGVRDGQLDRGVDLREQLAHEEGVAVVVLDQEDVPAAVTRLLRDHHRSSSLSGAPGCRGTEDGGSGGGRPVVRRPDRLARYRTGTA